MQVAILSARTGWHTDELCRALADRGHAARVLPYEANVARLGTTGTLSIATADPEGSALRTDDDRATADPEGSALRTDDDRAAPRRNTDTDTSLLDVDAVLARIIPNGSLEQIIYRVDALHWIESRGIPVINSPRAIERSVDKFYTTALLHDAGLPVPDTIVCERLEDAMAAVRAMGEVVIKPLFGSMGHGLVRVSDPEVAFRIVRALEQIKAVFYVQRAIPHEGRDIRVLVVGGRVLAAIERRAADGDWRANVSRGATARAIELPARWADLAVGAAAAVGADYAGVDLLPSSDGDVFVLEVNGIPGWQGLQRATGVDVAGAIVDHLLARATSMPRRRPSTSALPA
jgi:RimK family alpha-L-glutamate ligase